MAEAECPVCGNTEFETKDLSPQRDFAVYIVYCTECGHIVGCTGGKY